ncbi:MAG TPA: proteasome subunit beta, partial [archaeon]|nr:proteasome subunit beta [archaeon]
GIEDEKFTSTGSCSPVAYGVLEDGYKEGMSKEDGIKLAVRSIRSARERDVMSGGKLIWIVTIDKDGVKFVDRAKIDELAK